MHEKCCSVVPSSPSKIAKKLTVFSTWLCKKSEQRRTSVLTCKCGTLLSCHCVGCGCVLKESSCSDNTMRNHDLFFASGDSTVGSEHRARVMPVQHVDGPVDGNLYAQVSKTTRTTSGSRLANGGPGFQPNGPLNMSHDSGISSSAGGCAVVVSCE